MALRGYFPTHWAEEPVVCQHGNHQDIPRTARDVGKRSPSGLESEIRSVWFLSNISRGPYPSCFPESHDGHGPVKSWWQQFRTSSFFFCLLYPSLRLPSYGQPCLELLSLLSHLLLHLLSSHYSGLAYLSIDFALPWKARKRVVGKAKQ